MDQPRVGIHTNVRHLCDLASLVTASRYAGPPYGRPSPSACHVKVPLLALLALVHFRVALAGLVPGRRRRGDQGRIHNGAFTQQQAFGGAVMGNRVENRFAQLMLFEQVTEFKQGRGIRGRFSGKIDIDKMTNGLAVVDGILDALIRQPKALLGHMHPQHPTQTNGRATPASALRVKRDKRLCQYRPRRDRFYLGKKPVAPCLLLLRRIFEFGKTCLYARHLHQLTQWHFTTPAQHGKTKQE